MWLLMAFVVTSVVANDNLRVAYQWKQIDFEYPSINERQEAIINGTFIQENVIPVGLEVYKNRLFVTLPRWKKGVPASLAYIDLNGKVDRKMLLQHRVFNFRFLLSAFPFNFVASINLMNHAKLF
jgi:hypothetical protein